MWLSIIWNSEADPLLSVEGCYKCFGFSPGVKTSFILLIYFLHLLDNTNLISFNFVMKWLLISFNTIAFFFIFLHLEFHKLFLNLLSTQYWFLPVIHFSWYTSMEIGALIRSLFFFFVQYTNAFGPSFVLWER
jgi:hypothetical protein